MNKITHDSAFPDFPIAEYANFAGLVGHVQRNLKMSGEEP